VQIVRRCVFAVFGIDLLCEKPKEFSYEEKAKRIEECLGEEQVDLWRIRQLALSKGGLLEAKYRAQAWLRLVGVDDAEIKALDVGKKGGAFNSYPSPVSTMSVQAFEEEKKMECADGDLIRRDVGRSVLFRYTPSEHKATAQEEQPPTVPAYASERLAMVLEETIRHGGSTLHYYQGLHDVAGVLLHNMDYHGDATISILSRLCQSHFRDAMRENFGNVTWLLSVLLLPLVEKVEPNVHYAFQTAEVELSNVCLPWVITWFTHDMYHAETAGRLVDMFLSSHPLLPFYFAVAVITHPLLKQAILTADLDDPALLFAMVKKMPQSIVSDLVDDRDRPHDPSAAPRVSVQEVLEDAMAIMKRIPPRDLLHLVDKEELYSREDLLQRASSISMFKAVPSWSVAGGQLTGTLAATILAPSYSADAAHAKLASGVPILTDTVPMATILNNRNWGSRRYQIAKKKKRMSPLQKIRRRLFGRRRVT